MGSAQIPAGPKRVVVGSRQVLVGSGAKLAGSGVGLCCRALAGLRLPHRFRRYLWLSIATIFWLMLPAGKVEADGLRVAVPELVRIAKVDREIRARTTSYQVCDIFLKLEGEPEVDGLPRTVVALRLSEALRCSPVQSRRGEIGYVRLCC